MHILILNWKDIRNPSAGGAELVTFHLARRLVRDGHQVTVFVRAFLACQPTEIIDGVKVVRQGHKLSVYLRAFWYYLQLPTKPDLVIDMVNTLPWFTPWYVPPSKRVVYVNQLAAEVFWYHLPPLISHLAYWTERCMYWPYQTTSALCFSQSTKADLVSLGFPNKNVHVFPLGLDHTQYHLGEPKTQAPSFVFVGRLVRMKRADVCIEAMRLVVKKYPTARLILVGQGPAEGALRSRVQHVGLQPHVRFLRDHHQKIQAMQRSWALVLPSVKEGWGMVVTEAGACGTPAIVSNVTGLRDSTLHNQTGLVLSAFPSAAELAQAMIQIIADTPLRERLSAGALAWSQNFDWETSYRRFRDTLALANTGF